jgi:glycosyltransferase involved in cell wall biosynthesis
VEAQMDVSVIIPTTGQRSDMLLRAVSSVLEQTRSCTQVVVVVDGSLNAAQSVRDALPPVVEVVHTHGETPLGVSAARNLGAQEARSSLLAFLDDDDWWLPEHLERNAHSDATLSLGSFLKLNRAGELQAEKRPPATLHPRHFLVCNPGLRGSNLLVSRDFYLEMGGFSVDLPVLNDLDFGIRAAAQGALTYRRDLTPTVVFNNHTGPRLTYGPNVTAGVQLFWARHQHRMTQLDRDRFKERAYTMWGLTIQEPL